MDLELKDKTALARVIANATRIKGNDNTLKNYEGTLAAAISTSQRCKRYQRTWHSV